MDYNAPVYPAVPQEAPKKKLLRRVVLIAIEVFIVLLVIIFFLGIANYFNVISLSRAFPSQFGWLPRKPLAPIQLIQPSKQEGNVQLNTPGVLRSEARYVKSAIIYYTLTDVLVTKVREGGQFIFVISNVSTDLRLPELEIPDEVQVTLDGKNGTAQATKSDIKEQDVLTLYLTYNLKSSKWNVKHVAIQKRQ